MRTAFTISRSHWVPNLCSHILSKWDFWTILVKWRNLAVFSWDLKRSIWANFWKKSEKWPKWHHPWTHIAAAWGSSFELLMSRKTWGVYVVILKHHLDDLNRGYGLRIGGMVDLPSPTICEKVNFTSLIFGNEEWLCPSPLPLFMILGVIFWLVLVKKGQRSTRRHAKTSFVSFEDGIWS